MFSPSGAKNKETTSEGYDSTLSQSGFSITWLLESKVGITGTCAASLELIGLKIKKFAI